MKKKNAIMLADTRPALVGTVLLQLAKTNPGLFDEAIIYYTEPIDAKDRDLMESVLPCRFIEYRPPLPNELFEKPRFRLFSILMFCRYELPHYLNEFETVTWLDTDILIQGSLTGLIEAAKRKGAAFIREDPIHKTAENPDRMRTCFTEDLPGYQTDSYLYCSGTIVVSDKIKNFGDFTDWCYRKTVEWADILSLPDQGVLNAAIQEISMDVAPISGKIYCCYPYMGRNCSGAKIIHAWGKNKFWNDWYVYLHYPQWAEYYESWLSKGGSALSFEIKPRISVVIPSYKPNIEFMRECINSLMSQTRDGWERFSDFEIIIIAEPVEKEPLIQLVDSFRDKRIRLIFNEKRLGIAASLNKGIRLAQGTYIARLDDDDVCAAPRLFLQSEYLNGHPDITLCTSDFEYFGDMNEWRLSFEGDMSFAWSIFTCPFDHPTIMFRRDFFVDNDLFYDEERGYVEDWELWRRAFAKGMTVGCIHRPLFYHRWIQAASAGQTNRTVEMMRELVQKNFAELGVEIPTEDLPLVGPWNGKLLEEESINRLEGYFTEALEQNRKEKIYDQVSLKKVFSLRLEEARSGVLPGLSEKINQTVPHTPVEQAVPEKTYTQSATAQPKGAAYSKTGKMNWLKKIIIAIFKPLYRPFRHRYEDRILDIQQNVWINGGHHYDEIAKLDRIIDRQDVQLERQQELWAEIVRILREQQELHDVMEDLSEKQRVQWNMLSEMREEQVTQRNATNLVLSQQQTQQDALSEIREEQITQRNATNLVLSQQQTQQDALSEMREEQITQRNATNLVLSQQQTQQDALSEIREEQITQRNATNLVLSQQQGYLHLIPRERLERLTVHLVEHCNLNCQCCDNFSPVAEEAYTELEELRRDFQRLRELSNGNIGIIELSGGEALLHPDINCFMSMTREIFAKTEIQIVTNGILLSKMNDDFWKTCRQCCVVLVITQYPIDIRLDLIQSKAASYGVKWRYYSNDASLVKTSFIAPFDMTGNQNSRDNFTKCHHANECIYLRKGRIYTCSIAANVWHFNKYFDENLPDVMENSIDIYKAGKMREILEFLSHPIPLCRFCSIKERRYGLPWGISRREKSEWVKPDDKDGILV